MGIFTDCTPEEVKYFVEDSEAQFVVAHDQEQVDKVLRIIDDLPELEGVIYWEPKGLWFYDHAQLRSFERSWPSAVKARAGHPAQLKAGSIRDVTMIRPLFVTQVAPRENPKVL